MKNLYLLAVAILFATGLFAQSKGTRDKVDALNKAYDEREKTDLDQAEQLALEALRLAATSGYEKGEAAASANLGRVYIRRGNNKKALEYLFRSLKLYERQPDFQKNVNYGSTLSRLAGALYFEGDYERSLAYAHRAIEIGRKNNYNVLLGLASRVSGEVHRDNQRFDSALYYFDQASVAFTKVNDLTHLANIAIDIGLVHYYLGDYRQAIAFTKKFYSLAKKLNLETDYSIGLHNIGEFNYLLKNYSEALIYLDSAQLYEEKFHQYSVMLDTYRVKARVFNALHKTDSTSHYYELAMAMKDSIANTTYKKEFASLQTQMDVYRHETENKILVNEKSIATLYRNLAISGAVALIFLLAFVLARQRIRVQNEVKRKLENEVAERTAEVMKQKNEIENVNLKLQLSLNRAKVDPHFVFNVLNSIQHLVIEKQPAEASDHLARLSRLTRYILEKSSLDSVPLRDEVKMLDQYIRLEQLRLDNKFEFQIRVEAPEDAMIPAMLIQPYVENAIVHGITPAHGTQLRLEVLFVKTDHGISVTVEDNGVGLQKKTPRNGHQSIGSTLGKDRLKILSQLNHGEYAISMVDLATIDNNATGTRITLDIPLLTNPTSV